MNKLVYSSLLFLLLFAGCARDFEDLELEEWKPIVAVPLVYSEITIDDVLTELNHPEEVLILDNGVVALNYAGDLISFNPENLLDIGDQSFSETVQIGTTEALAIDADITDVTLPLNVPIVLDASPAEIIVDEVLISSGSIEVSVTRNQDENISGELQINELIGPDNQPLSITIEGDEPVDVAEAFTVDLTGYTMNPTLIPPFTNQLSLSGTMTLSDNSMNTATSGDFVTFSFVLSNLDFEHIIGDFGNLSLSSDTDTVTINLFDNIEGGAFSLSNAIIELDVTNSFGLPTDIELGSVVSVNQNTGVETQLFLSDISLEGQETLGGAPENQLFIFDNDNSNISPLFDPAPVDIVFNIDATANPAGPPPPDNLNFITNESSFDIDIDVILPLEGYAIDVLVSDTLSVDFSFDEYTEIDSLEFRLETTNEFPIDVNFQAYFLDDANTILDSLFITNTSVLTSAQIDSDGDVINPTASTLFFTLQNERAADLELATKVNFSARFNTGESDEQQEVRIKSDQALDIELGVKLFGNVEL